MRFDGVYETDTATAPKAVRATGSQQEWEHAGAPVSLPVTPAPVYQKAYDPFTGWGKNDVPSGKHSAELPPDRELINQIAQRVEVECDDKRLIDWMSGKE